MSRDTLICRNVKKLSRCQKENQFITHVHIHTRCTRYCLSDTGVNTKPVHNRSCWLCISTKRLTPQICCREQFQATPIWQWHVMSLSYVWLQKRQLWLKKKGSRWNRDVTRLLFFCGALCRHAEFHLVCSDSWTEKPAFGTALDEHLKRSGREIALPIEACVMMLLETGMKEEVIWRKLIKEKNLIFFYLNGVSTETL